MQTPKVEQAKQTPKKMMKNPVAMSYKTLDGKAVPRKKMRKYVAGKGSGSK
jgi:beta-lactamase class D